MLTRFVTLPFRLSAVVLVSAVLGLTLGAAAARAQGVEVEPFGAAFAGWEEWALNLLNQILQIVADFFIAILREIFAGIQSLLGQTPAPAPEISLTLPDGGTLNLNPSDLAPPKESVDSI